MQQRARIVVVGSSNTDMVVRTSRIPAPGETVLGGDFVMVPGGKGANQAVAAARLGAEVTFVARVGADLFGENSIRNIGGAGVRTEYIIRDADTPSGVALIFVEESGQNTIVVAPGANMRLSPHDVERARPAFEAADIVVAQLEVPSETVLRTISLAKELGKRVLLNPAPAPSSSLSLHGVDVLTPNEVEAAMLLGWPLDASFDAKRAALALMEKHALGAVIVTLGEKGAVVVMPEGAEEIAPIPVQAVDTTAAGDCFTGALACALGEGRDLISAARFANAAAAISVTRLGAQPSMPIRDEVSG